MISRFIGFIICIFAVLLPWRIRIIFAEIVGWFVQIFYGVYYGLFNFMLKELRKAKLENKEKEIGTKIEK